MTSETMTPTATTDCGCGCGGHGGGTCHCEVCHCDNALERPRFYARQLVTPGELNLASAYLVERMRRHNRLLHGWGVVCGAQVCRVEIAGTSGAQPWKVRIRPGYLIDGCGNEVTIDCERIVDLRTSGVVAACGDPPGELRDPWCRDVDRERKGRVWIAVCHKEILARPVPVQPAGCGCDDTGCEYSRWHDGYEVRLLDGCPKSHLEPPPTPQQFIETLGGPLPECPCPDDPCVVLAVVDVDGEGAVTAIDNCSCRRMIASAAGFWWRCAAGMLAVHDVSIKRKAPYTPGMSAIRMVLKGQHLTDDVAVDLGPGVTVSKQQVDTDGTELQFDVGIAKDATPGERDLRITRGDCSTVVVPQALTIAPVG
jgi:hypothetical protein